ncbi:MAG: hypothetical protein C4326_07080 [Ignavibacteria bacterium]
MHSVILVTVLVVSALIGCQNHERGSTILEEPTQASQTNQRVATTMPSKNPVLDSLIGVSAAIVEPLVGATIDVGGCSFRIPPRAIGTPTFISFAISKGNPPAGLHNMPKRLFRFHPEGLIFLQNCELVVPFSALELGSIDPSTLSCWYYNPVTRTYEPEPTVVDLQAQRYVVQIRHFSIYGFGRAQ